MKLHLCGVTGTCRDVGAPVRLYVHTRKWTYIMGAKTQEYKDGRYTDRWKVFVRHPAPEEEE